MIYCIGFAKCIHPRLYSIVFSKYIGYNGEEDQTYTKLTGFVARGPRALQCRLYRKTSNQVNLVSSMLCINLVFET